MNDLMEHLTNSKVKQNLTIMTEVRQSTRNLLFSKGFNEIDTPILMPRTGERYNSTFDVLLDGSKAMLADSPQIFKMLLSKAGYEKYFQFAHCFRSISNENNLHTRLSEFIQLDIELKNTNLDDLIKLAESLISKICMILHKTLKISRMQGIMCRSRYGQEMRPDLRESEDEISLVIIKNMPLTNDGKIPCHHIFAMPSDFDSIHAVENLTELTTESFDIVMNGIEIGGGDMRINDCNTQTEMMRLFNVDEKRYINYLEILNAGNINHNGGFAIGLERMVMALSHSENIRQVTAFPDYYRRGVN